MAHSPSILDEVIQFLIEGGDVEAANLLRRCTIESFEVVDHWMDGARRLDGILIELAGPRACYEFLTDERDHRNTSIENAFRAVMPSGAYLKSLRVRAISPKTTTTDNDDVSKLTSVENEQMIGLIEAQKACMISVATGGPRINDVKKEYEDRRNQIRVLLNRITISDPNPYSDLWGWYGKWSDGSLPTYQSRRQFITDLYQPLLDALTLSQSSLSIAPLEPTGWARVDRNFDKIVKALETAKNEEDFQAIALLCREEIISLAQAVFNSSEHPSFDGIAPSATDAKRMLESYIAKKLSGESHDYHRRFARAAYDLAVNLQHRRTACFRDAALCAEATRSLIHAIAIISGHRDP